ncbi:MAG: Uma2 family endonuclease [Planctomycetaceae bacterium]
MSAAELLEPDVGVETVFDADDDVARLGPESSGLLMSKEEFRAVEEWDESYRYELIHGVVVVSPPPAEGERGPNDEFSHWLRLYRDTHPQGSSFNDTLYEQEIDTGPCIRRADRVIWAGLGRQPNTKTDVPTIVIEIVSKRRRDQRRDYEEKRKEYAAIGVQEYWVFDRFRRTLSVCRGNEVSRIVKAAETYETPLLPGFELPVGKLLAVADRWTKEGK